MTRVLCLAAALAALLCSGDAQAQPVLVASAPEADSSGVRCTRAGALRVCYRPSNGEFVVTDGAHEQARWNGAPGAPVFDLRAFAVGDRLVVATLDNVRSGGLNVTSWTLGVLLRGARAPAYSFTVEDLSPTGGSFGTWRGQAVLWATEWVWTTMPDPAGRRPPGTYLVGRPFTLGDDALVPATRLPIRARRLLRTFSRESGTPVEWLTDRRAETLRADPLLAGTARTTRGTVTAASVRMENGWPALAVTLRPASGPPLALLSQWRDGAPWFTHIADDATGRVWPADYRPADASAWLVGRRARLEVRDDGPGVLWRE